MGILDEAIREHLELKRQHGAEETELKGLEDDAFGPADRPDAVGPTASGEAETRIISPGSSVTAPAGEGDQPDEVFDATRQAEPGEPSATGGAEPEADQRSGASGDAEATFAEHPIPQPPAPAEPGPGPEPGPEGKQAGPESGPDREPSEDPKAESEAKSEPEVTEAATVESPEAKPSQPDPESPSSSGEGDAGDLLEAERHHLASHPTEHYDVDAAIAEEDEIDELSESSLSDELDRALDSGEVGAAGRGTSDADVPAEFDSAETELEEPDSGEFGPDQPEYAEEEAIPDPTGEPEEEDSAEILYEDAAGEDQPVEEGDEGSDTGEAEEGDSADFFDQDDPLEATPEFLEETPEHDQLWFEQKEPKDFDFGD